MVLLATPSAGRTLTVQTLPAPVTDTAVPLVTAKSATSTPVTGSLKVQV